MRAVPAPELPAPELPALAVVLDTDRLSSLFGQVLQADYLRYKPGHSVVARIRFDDGRLGWLAGFSPGQWAKAGKLAQRAGRHPELRIVRLPAGGAWHTLVLGPLHLDRRLHRPLQLLRLHRRMARWNVQVLNYVPDRRLVISLDVPGGGRIVAKVAARPSPATVPLLAALRRAGVPVLERIKAEELASVPTPAPLPDSGLIAYYPWFEGTDLQQLAVQEPAEAQQAAHRAGEALAALHAVRPAGNAQTGKTQPGSTQPGIRRAGALADAGRKAVAAAAETGLLAPGLAPRLTAVSSTLTQQLTHVSRPERARGAESAGGTGGAEGTGVMLHGDFSADQVLVSGEELRLADLDRWTCGPAASDLGCFAAVELLASGGTEPGPLFRALLAGYGTSSGVPVPDGEELATWTAFHLLARIQDPFRDCTPDWPAVIARRLEQVEAVLG